jgi:large subunit ribosomal protein L35
VESRDEDKTRSDAQETSMPKQKTHRGAAKRFRLTAGGKVKRSKAFKSHILTKKTTKRKRQLDTPALVSDADQKRLARMLPYGGR